MPRRPIYHIVAMAQNRVIGRNGRLPWKIPEDWEFFLNKTLSGTLIMGRTCYEAFEKHCAERDVIVCSRTQTSFAHARRAASLDEAIAEADKTSGDEPIWICGGEGIYRDTFPIADCLYLTLVEAKVPGDAFYPEGWEEFFPTIIESRKSQSGGYALDFQVLSAK